MAHFHSQLMEMPKFHHFHNYGLYELKYEAIEQIILKVWESLAFQLRQQVEIHKLSKISAIKRKRKRSVI